MFEKTCNYRQERTMLIMLVTDLIRGLRANKKDEQRYIQSAINECKKEAKSQDIDVKAGAILKLTYLAMFGQDMGWASFYTVEVMASTNYINKRIGYMAASQGFRQDTDVLMLATNLMQKDIASTNFAEVSIALSSLGDIVTPDLARDLGHNLISKLTHSQATVRKKAVLSMYKIFLQYPEALRSSYPKLRERLEDSDQSVVSATINVIVELSRKNPKNYLPLAPTLFELLTTSTNNWMLIKIVKLFATLTPLEPRLVKKLITPLSDIIHSTSAMSLLYECINTVISGDMLSSSSGDTLAQLCIHKLRTFFDHDDQNLKYVGLIALTKLMNTYPDLVSKHQDIILKAVDDTDLSIRMRALELVSLMPTRKSLPDIVKKLVLQLAPEATLAIPLSFRRDLVLRLIKMCNSDNYKYIENFDWYLATLIDLVRLANVDVGTVLQLEIRNVCVRVGAVREFGVPALAQLACDRTILDSADAPERNALVLSAAVWAVAEYSEHLEDGRQTLNDLLAAPMQKLAASVQADYLQAILKLYCRSAANLGSFDSVTRTETLLQTQQIARRASEFTESREIEVQHRAVEMIQLCRIAEQCIEEEVDTEYDTIPQFFSNILPSLFSLEEHINPIAPTAQSHIVPPQDLDLTTWIHPLTPQLPPVQIPDVEEESIPDVQLSESELAERRRERRERNMDDPFYIQDAHQDDRHETNEHDTLVSTDNSGVTSMPDDLLLVKRKKRRPKPSGPVVILNDELPEGLQAAAPQVTSETSAKKRHPTNVLKVDGSRLSDFSLDEKADEPNDDEYRIIEQARQDRTSLLNDQDQGTLEVIKKKVSFFTQLH